MPLVIDPPPAPPVPVASTSPDELWRIFYENLGWYREQDEAGSGDLALWSEALWAPLQPMYELVCPREDTDSWEILFDPDRCPDYALPWLARCVGVEPSADMSTLQLRDEIRRPTGWRRGQTESIRIGTRRTLKPVAEEELMVIVRPRTPEWGRHYIRTLSVQTPEPDRTEWLVEHKLTPAWERVDYAAIDGVTYADIAASYPSYRALREAFATYRELRDLLPSELPKP